MACPRRPGDLGTHAPVIVFRHRETQIREGFHFGPSARQAQVCHSFFVNLCFDDQMMNCKQASKTSWSSEMKSPSYEQLMFRLSCLFARTVDVVGTHLVSALRGVLNDEVVESAQTRGNLVAAAGGLRHGVGLRRRQHCNQRDTRCYGLGHQCVCCTVVCLSEQSGKVETNETHNLLRHCRRRRLGNRDPNPCLICCPSLSLVLRAARDGKVSIVPSAEETTPSLTCALDTAHKGFPDDSSTSLHRNIYSLLLLSRNARRLPALLPVFDCCLCRIFSFRS